MSYITILVLIRAALCYCGFCCCCCFFCGISLYTETTHAHTLCYRVFTTKIASFFFISLILICYVRFIWSLGFAMHIIQGLLDIQLLFYLQNITADIYRAITTIIFLECPKVKCLASIHTHAARGLFTSSSVSFLLLLLLFLFIMVELERCVLFQLNLS